MRLEETTCALSVVNDRFPSGGPYTADGWFVTADLLASDDPLASDVPLASDDLLFYNAR